MLKTIKDFYKENKSGLIVSFLIVTFGAFLVGNFMVSSNPWHYLNPVFDWTAALLWLPAVWILFIMTALFVYLIIK